MNSLGSGSLESSDQAKRGAGGAKQGVSCGAATHQADDGHIDASVRSGFSVV